MKVIKNFFKSPNFGVLLLRSFIGSLVMMYGIHSLTGGKAIWMSIGNKANFFGLNHCPLFWGVTVSLLMIVCGIFFIIGIFFRPSCFLLLAIILASLAYHMRSGVIYDNQVMQSMTMTIVFLSLFFIGPGRFSFSNDE